MPANNKGKKRSPDRISNADVFRRALDCLHRFGLLIETNLSLSELYQGVVDLLPIAASVPKNTSARLVISDTLVFSTRNFADSPWFRACDIMVSGEKRGVLEIAFLRKVPDPTSCPLANEDSTLLEDIAERLGRVIERQETFNALIYSNSRYKNLFELSPAAIFVLGEDGNFLSANKTAESIFGYNQRELLGLHLRDILADKIGKKHADSLNALKKDKTLTIQVKGKRKDGTSFPANVSFRTIDCRSEDCYQVLIQDITSQHNLTRAKQYKKFAQARFTAQEEERKRIARELHDEIGQVLTVLKLTLGMIKQDYPGLARKIENEINEINGIIDTTIDQVRKMSSQLRSERLEILGLLPALREEAKLISRKTGIQITLSAKGLSGKTNSRLDNLIYQLVKESLTNIAKHSQATKSEIKISSKGKTLLLEIRDNGKGFDISGNSSDSGLGLIGMRERLAEVDGLLNIHSARDGGTRLKISIPF